MTTFFQFMRNYRLCQQHLVTVCITKLDVNLPISMSRNCCDIVACIVSGCCRRAIKACGHTLSLLSVSTVTLNVALQPHYEGVSLLSYLQMEEAKLRSGKWAVKVVHIFKQLNLNLELRAVPDCFKQLINCWLIFLKDKCKSRHKIYTKCSATEQKERKIAK